MHGSLDGFTAALKMLKNAPLTSADSAMLVVLGLGLLLRDCKHAMEYEEEEATSDTPSYLANSVLNVSCISKVDSIGRHVLGEVVGLIEAATPVAEGFEVIEGNKEVLGGEMDEKNNENEDKGEGEGNTPIEGVQEGREDETSKEEFKQKGKKRPRDQDSGNTSKKLRTEDLRRSDRSRQPSKKVIEAQSRQG